MKRALAIVGVLLLCGALMAVAVLVWARQSLYQPRAISAWQDVFVVRQGASVAAVAQALAKRGAIDHPQLLRAYARWFARRPIQAGEYQLPERAAPVELLRLLQSGRVISYSVTLVEGRTFEQWLATLAATPTLDSSLLGMDEQARLEALALPIEHPEGWFFPDSYQYTQGTRDIEILRRAHARMLSELENAWSVRAPDLPIATPYEALILASLIERETGVPEERPTIAGVFVRRLQRGMRLQTDPSVIYGLGVSFDGNLTRAQLRTDTPYNTYTRNGLPPTPIAMPGRAALLAATQPAVGDALFFVARGDGTHHFSATLDEHNAAVRRYQLQRRQDYRSAPPRPVHEQ